MENKTTGNQILGIVITLAILFVFVWVISRAWKAGQ